MGKEIDVKTCLQTIDDLVTVEDKLVTYRSLSKVLKVHTDQAKQLLNSYVDKAREKSKKDELAVVYLIGGLVKGAASVTRFTLVSSDNLENEKQRFSQVDTEHVYSVCRGRQVTIADIYNAAESVTELEKEFSSIKCNDEDVQRRLRERSIPPPQAPSTSNAEAVKKEKPVNQIPNVKKEAEPSKPLKKSPEKKKTSPKKKEAAAAPKGGGINAMFQRQAEKKKEEEKSALKHEPEKQTTKEAPKAGSPDPEPPAKQRDKKKQKKSASKPRNNKKLRRIRVMSDSESDSGSEEVEKDEEKEDELRRMDLDEHESPEPTSGKSVKAESDDEIIPVTPVDESKKGRKRIRKQVDKSFVDEEGYLCVRKEYVFESCSDEDGETPAKSPKTGTVPEPQHKPTISTENTAQKFKDKTGKVDNKSKRGKKMASPQKGKQASITSFFKKK